VENVNQSSISNALKEEHIRPCGVL